MPTTRTIPSPINPLQLVANHTPTGPALTAIRFTPIDQPTTKDPALTHILDHAEHELTNYFEGNRTTFTVPTHQPATPFQQRVWDHLRTIPHGETTTYGRIAQALNNPNAARAVGLANAKNQLPIIIPCHRVLNANHQPHGYAGGLSRKQFLLNLERPTAPLFN